MGINYWFKILKGPREFIIIIYSSSMMRTNISFMCTFITHTGHDNGIRERLDDMPRYLSRDTTKPTKKKKMKCRLGKRLFEKCLDIAIYIY